MQFTPREKRQLNLSGKRQAALYPHALQFYKVPPTNVISLEEFEDLALERLKVLRLVERAGAKFNKNSNDYKEMVNSELKKMKLIHYYKLGVGEVAEIDESLSGGSKVTIIADNHTKCHQNWQIWLFLEEVGMISHINDEIYDGRRRDHISHFILRLAYCRREDLRRWFINQEVDLFRFRFTAETTEFKKSFMKLNDLNYDEISEEEKNALGENLRLGYTNTMLKVKSTKFYKVPFTEVLDLVKNRRVYLNQGCAYITEDDLVLTVLSAYRTHLSHALAITSRALPQLQEDTRLISMLATLHQRYIGTDYSKRRVEYTGEVSPEQIDELSKTSFPLCMRNLHEVLRKSHHVKYNGRLQYGLFLKGIGMTLEDALRFWRDEFTKVMDIDKFDKQYSYNIRYNYGKEGKRANFSPYSCMKIIMSNNPGPGEYHGCPFKHSDENNLRQRLQSLHISSGGINSIADLATKGHYQIACTRFFELTHNDATPDQGISHPNHYFEESRKVLLGTKKEEKTVSSPMTQNTSQKSQSQPSTADTETDDMDCEPMEDIEEILSALKGV